MELNKQSKSTSVAVLTIPRIKNASVLKKIKITHNWGTPPLTPTRHNNNKHSKNPNPRRALKRDLA